MAKFADSLRDVSLAARPCPDSVAHDAIRDAAIEFCTRTKIWIFVQQPIATIVGEPSYPYELPTETRVVTPMRGTYRGTPLTFLSHDQIASAYAGGDWRSQTGAPRIVTMDDTDSFLLVPIPTEAVPDAVQLELALKPSQSAKSYPDWLYEEWRRALEAGALANILGRNKKDPWYDDKKAKEKSIEFRRYVAQGEARARNRFTRTTHRAYSPFRFA